MKRQKKASQRQTSQENLYKKRGQFAETWSRFRKKPVAMIALIGLILVLAIAIFADVIVDYDLAIKQNGREKEQSPSAVHILGTDRYGRDMFARVIHGTRMAVLIGVVSMMVSLVVGTGLALLASYFGGVVDMIIMRIIDILNSIPSLIIALAICAGLGSGTWQLIVALSVSSVPFHTRMTRSRALSVVQMDYVESAQALGVKTPKILLRHVVPNIISIVIIQGTANVAVNILTGATLGFIGLGVKAPTPEWGLMLSEGLDFMSRLPYMVYVPGTAIVITSLLINTFGDCLRDAMDPQLKGRA